MKKIFIVIILLIVYSSSLIDHLNESSSKEKFQKKNALRLLKGKENTSNLKENNVNDYSNWSNTQTLTDAGWSNSFLKISDNIIAQGSISTIKIWERDTNGQFNLHQKVSNFIMKMNNKLK